MSNGFMPIDEANERLTQQAIAHANSALETTRELRQEVSDLNRLIAALVMSNGGVLYLNDREAHDARTLESYRDERNRRWVFRVVPSEEA